MDATRLCLVCLAWAGAPVAMSHAADETLDERLARMEQIIRQQQADLEAQQRQLDEQSDLIRQLQSSQGTSQAVAIPMSPAKAPTEDGDLSGQKAAVAEFKKREEAGAAESGVDAQATLYDRSSTVFDPDFPGAWHLPGTTAAMKLGGYVNLAIAHNLDPIGSEDSFVVGKIPASGSAVRGPGSNTYVSANQTRTNLEVREQTSRGMLRAFVEGDFRGNGSSFRLRHAYGQFGPMLAGKTWSTFANVDALPDEVDFEGVNGSILQRQPQLRFFPRLGKNHNLIIAIEEPTTEVENGDGFRGRGDFVISIDNLPLGKRYAWNYKVAAVYRDLRAELPDDGSAGTTGDGRATGWGITTSGQKTVPYWGDEDFIQWQVTYGEGIGHYIHDLWTIGGGDAVFDPQGDLHALPLFAGFLSYNHNWRGKPGFFRSWPGLFRSSLMFSWVDIDNLDFQADDSYDRTLRASANLFYFPAQNIRLGAEFLWGQRTNKDDSKGSAKQLQISARYSY